MSRRTSEASKAIRLAWEKEQKLVLEGKGTRDWTEQQQQDILNPEKGKAYDDSGRSFEGQHMKSVAEYPEFQGNPDNIQFLTREEHLAAHGGNWQNPTNWYYDPVAKTFTRFGDDELIPCPIQKLSNPIIVAEGIDSVVEDQDKKITQNEETYTSGVPPNDEVSETYSDPGDDKSSFSRPSVENYIPKRKGIFDRLRDNTKTVAKTVGRVIYKNRWRIARAGATWFLGKAISSAHGGITDKNANVNRASSQQKKPVIPVKTAPKSSTYSEPKPKDVLSELAETAKSVYKENDVPAHKQRYHTKNGQVWREKPPYHRGSKK